MIGAGEKIGAAAGAARPLVRRVRRVDRARLRVLLAGRGLIGRVTYLVATQAVTVLIGFLYWTVTARFVAAHQIGVAAAATSTAMLLGAIGALGVTTIMLVALGSVEPEDELPLVTTGLMISGASVFLLAVGTWALSPVLGPSLRALGANPLDGLLFVSATVATACGAVLDAAAIGTRRGAVQLARNAVASVLKVVLVFGCVLFAARTTTGLLVAWNVATVASLLVSPRLLHLRSGPHGRVTLGHRVEMILRYWSLSLQHHVLNMAIGAVTYFLPVVAALIVDPKDMAYFAVAQLVSSSVLMLPFFFATSLFVESAGDEVALRHNVRKTFPIGMAACLCLVGIFEPASKVVLSVFGAEYEAHGSAALHLLLLGGFGYVVKDHFMAVRRAQNRLGEAARFGVLSTSVELAGAALGGSLGGLTGLCAGWVAATVVDGCAFFPAVWAVLRRHPRRAHERHGSGGHAELAVSEVGATRD